MGKQDTRNKILDAAMDLFAVRGYSAVTTKELAQQAGVSEVTLFRHFPSKRTLFTTIARERVEESLVSKIETAGFSWDLERDLTVILDMMKKLFQDNIKVIKMNMKDMPRLYDGSGRLPHFPDLIKTVVKNYFPNIRKEWEEERTLNCWQSPL